MMSNSGQPTPPSSTGEATFLARFATLEAQLMRALQIGTTAAAETELTTFLRTNQHLLVALPTDFLSRCLCGLAGSLAATGVTHFSDAMGFVYLRNYVLTSVAAQPVRRADFGQRLRYIFRDFTQLVADDGRDIRVTDLSKQVRLVINYIDLNQYEKLSPRGITASLGLPYARTGDLFKRETGLPISGYIRRAKMREAKRLLRQTDTTVRDIAAMLGYYDAANFTKRFRAQFGIPPSAYREQHHEPLSPPQ